MLNLGAPDRFGNFCGVYLPYLEQYTRRLIISLETKTTTPRSLNSYDDNLQTISDMIFSSKNFAINWQGPNFCNASTIQPFF